MLREPPLLDAYKTLIEATDRHKRGRDFEHIIARLFRSARMHVELNPGAAAPRQTDLVATGAGAMYLIETKWRAAAANINDLDSLRSRLARTPGAIGILVSVSGFSEPVVDHLEADRDPQVLLIDGEELEQMLAGNIELKTALSAKEDALRIHGEVALASRPRRARPRRPLQSGPTPSDTQFVLRDGTSTPWFAAGGGYGPFTFARSVTDPDWVPAGGAGVTVDIPLAVRDVDGIISVLTELADLDFSTAGAHWNIHQAAVNWHGMGGESLAGALRGWKERYTELDSFHHTEQVCYQDVCDDGFYTLTFGVDASARRRVWHAALSMILTGIPLDTQPIQALRRTFNVEQAVHFRPRTERALTVTHFTRDRETELEILASIVESQSLAGDEEDWVGGIVIKNPFHRADGSRDDRLPDGLAGNLCRTEALVCDLSSWHPHGEHPGPYHLLRCEWGWTSNALVARVSADWESEPRAPQDKRPHRPSSTPPPE